MAPRKASKPTSRASKSSTKPKASSAFPFTEPLTSPAAATPPTRAHSAEYHYPLLLSSSNGCSDALLEWFEGIEEKREMPWRKKWIDPETFEGSEEELGNTLAKRAYEVWVSEIMLQQTRVSTVIPYFKNWISKWPTIHDLAAANHDDVLAAWKGLGYYSRATRLHEGAKAMIAASKTSKTSSPPCLIPSTAQELQNFPGIGRYTAGAISSIAFGVAEPVLDGNVIRVLSRQLGIYADAKEKKVNDAFWDAADLLIKHVGKSQEVEKSKVPGMWNQAMMELGSTVCTPRPKCGECPIRGTCRTYAEGRALAEQRKKGDCKEEVADIEDACQMCNVLDTEDLVTVPDDDDAEDDDEDGEVSVKSKTSKKRKVELKKKEVKTNKISQYFTVKTPASSTIPTPTPSNPEKEGDEPINTNGSNKRKAPGSDPEPSSNSVAAYCSLFPKRIPKKKPAEEEAVVCIIELQQSQPNSSSKYLIEQRPAKGLLASLWQFPQSTLQPSPSSTPASRKSKATDFVRGMDVGGSDRGDMQKATHVKELGSLVHIFSHLRLTMHVQHFKIKGEDNVELGGKGRKWVAMEDMDGETLSTGMRRCWHLVKESKT